MFIDRLYRIDHKNLIKNKKLVKIRPFKKDIHRHWYDGSAFDDQIEI